MSTLKVNTITNAAGTGAPAVSFGIIGPVTTKTGNYTATAADETILVDCTSGAVTITMPSASTAGKRITVVKTDASANKVTVQRAASDTLAGATSFKIGLQYDSADMVSNGGTLWHILKYPVISAHYRLESTVASDTSTPINYGAKIYDSADIVTTGVGTWVCTAALAGFYDVGLNGHTSSASTMRLYKNGSLYAAMNTTSGGTYSGTYVGVELAIGDTFNIRTSVSVNVVDDPSAGYPNRITISRRN